MERNPGRPKQRKEKGYFLTKEREKLNKLPYVARGTYLGHLMLSMNWDRQKAGRALGMTTQQINVQLLPALVSPAIRAHMGENVVDTGHRLFPAVAKLINHYPEDKHVEILALVPKGLMTEGEELRVLRERLDEHGYTMEPVSKPYVPKEEVSEEVLEEETPIEEELEDEVVAEEPEPAAVLPQEVGERTTHLYEWTHDLTAFYHDERVARVVMDVVDRATYIKLWKEKRLEFLWNPEIPRPDYMPYYNEATGELEIDES